jgi:hypothetical protein
VGAVHREKYLQVTMTVIRAKGCVTRRFLLEFYVKKFGLSGSEAVNAVKNIVKKLRARGIITLKGPGVYCWNVPTAVPIAVEEPAEPITITLDL